MKAHFPVLLCISSWATHFVWFFHSHTQFANTMFEIHKIFGEQDRTINFSSCSENCNLHFRWQFNLISSLHEAKILQLMFSNQLSSYHLFIPFLASSQCNQIPAKSCMQTPWAISYMFLYWWICLHRLVSKETSLFYLPKLLLILLFFTQI